MKAFILAAGNSTRLGQLGAEIPKPMLRLHGRPVLEWTIERLQRSGITQLVVNLHHAPDVIPMYFGDGSRHGVRISYTFEQHLLGTAGAIWNARHLLGSDAFLVVYGDTVLDWDPTDMVEGHRRARPAVTIVVAHVPDPSSLGTVYVDDDGAITRFVEKSGDRSELGGDVSAGLCVMEACVLDHIPPGVFCDLGTDVFPTLLERGLAMHVYPRPRPLLLLDTVQQYAWAQQHWEPP